MGVPAHVAIIMDGNGRWAKQRLLPRVAGHRRGVEAVRTIVRTAVEALAAVLGWEGSSPRGVRPPGLRSLRRTKAEWP